MIGKLQQVHLRINDLATGKPTPVRLRVTDSVGNYYAPLGRLKSFATAVGVDVGNNVLLPPPSSVCATPRKSGPLQLVSAKPPDQQWCFIDGACEIALPPGPVRIQATKGPEYRPLDEEMQLIAGKLSLRLGIERWIDLRAEGWYSGDCHATFLSPHAALLEAGAEDLAVVDLLIREGEVDGAAILSNIEAFSGQSPSLETPGHLVAVNSRNQSPDGRLLLLHCQRVVHPLSFGEGERWSLLDWCDQCHRKKGLVIGDDWLLRVPNPRLTSDEFLRRLDAIRYHADVPLDPWFDALNRGFRIPLVGGSGKESNREVLGAWRTYAQSSPLAPREVCANPPQPSSNSPPESTVPAGSHAGSYMEWIEAIRAGRTFVTRGPILRLTLQSTGTAVPGLSAPREVVASAEALEAIAPLEIIANGQVIAMTDESRLSIRPELPAGSWLIARCNGAITSPVYLD